MKRTETAEASLTWVTDDSLKQIRDDLRREGLRMAKEYRRRGHDFALEILSPSQVRAGDSVQLSAAVMELDWKLSTKLEMVKAAKDMITNSYMLGSLDPALSIILKSVIQEEGLYEYTFGEFFLLYGRFEQKYDVFKGKETREKMEELIKGEKEFFKPYKDHGKESLVPLPYAARNILAHVGNTNTLDEEGKELRTSIDLLRAWLQ